jgi:hypothetical protein
MKRLAVLLVLAVSAWSVPASADPCGMVPPVWTGQGPPITRTGPQKTYVFYKDGVETYVIRPGFAGKVDNFGMLIPFPSVPSIRKVPDETFAHIAAAIDPPEVVIDLNPYPEEEMLMESAGAAPSAADDGAGLRVARNEVRVVKEEAIGMYEIVVLEAGSPKALQRWMEKHGFQYPKGMDATVEDYVQDRWMFVAVKTRVGPKAGVDPKPGMRRANDKLPAGAGFDGFVQAMGFRFEVDEPVVPMRLSAFNEGETRNVVYFLNGDPVRVQGVDKKVVRRQLKGRDVYDNVTGPLPLRIYGGTYEDVSDQLLKDYEPMRRPEPHNAIARDLFASDILAVKTKNLAHEFEEREKVLLNISERLNLRGPEIDQLHQQELDKARKETLGDTIAGIKGMTLTVIDGEFPREHIAKHNVTFERYTMARVENVRMRYDARALGPGGSPGGVRVERDQKKNPFLKLWKSVWE